MFAVEMKEITKRFPQLIANDRIDFCVEEGEIHCLLGENGAGKSTLMKVLFGLYHPEEGEIKVKGKKAPRMTPNLAFDMGIGMVHQHFMLIEKMTVLENIILGYEPGNGMLIDRKTAVEKIMELSEKYGFSLRLNEKVENLSVGEKQRVEIMKTLYRGADILILDEPTAVLTPLEIRQLLQGLRDMRRDHKTIIFITHKLNETMEVSDHVTVLRGGKSVAHVKTSETSPEALASLMVGQPMNFEVIKSEVKPTDEVILSLQNVSLTENASNPFSLDVKGGEILGIAGVDGNGQQELEELIIGLRKCQTGQIFLQGKEVTHVSSKERRETGIGYIPADRWKHGIVRELSLKENYLLGKQFRSDYVHHGFIQQKYLEKKANELNQRFDVRSVSIDQPIGSLSGGNQQKLVLGREVESSPKFVLASQPTRGLDIGAIQYIKEELLRLRSEGKAVLLISADLTDLFQMSDRIAVLYKGEMIALKSADAYTNESISLLMAGKKEDQDAARKQK